MVNRERKMVSTPVESADWTYCSLGSIKKSLDVKPAFKSQIKTVTRESLRFRLTLNIIGISGMFFNAMFAQVSWLQIWFWTLFVASVCGFILSCIDYAKAE